MKCHISYILDYSDWANENKLYLHHNYGIHLAEQELVNISILMDIRLELQVPKEETSTLPNINIKIFNIYNKYT